MSKLVGLISVVAMSACGAELVRVAPRGTDAGTTTAAQDPTFEIVARVAGVKDPMPVAGAHVAFVDLETALGQAVRRSLHPRPDSVLTVELIAGDATYRDTRFAVSLVARATLRTRQGNAFVAQTQLVCRDGAIVAPEAGATVIWSCLTHLGDDLGGWLEGLPPHA